MKILNLKIEKLHGYIDKDICFNDDLTLLVGINGSGKTSILNIINWIISPSLPSLCITDFKKITLSFKLNNELYEVECKHKEENLYYSIKSSKRIYNPLIVKIHRHPGDINNDEPLRARLFEKYIGLTPDDKEEETWELVSTFPNPNVIGLDRNLYTEESESKIYLDEEPRSILRRKQAKANISPLDRVKDLVNSEYRKRKNQVLNHTNSLKNHLMFSTFDGSITIESFTSGIRSNLTQTQIDRAESRVNDYFKKFEKTTFSDNERETIDNYFSQLKNITNKYQEDPEDESTKLLYGLNANQFIKVKKLLTEFEKFEVTSQEIMRNIQVYIDTLNFFLKDSAKKILFKEDTSEITFNTLDKNGNIITEYRDINHLSSGEQQVLILFSYIAFNSSDGKIFIIDEPELSLHIKWQEDFLDKLYLITPESTQLLLATHSPILANKKKDKAITLIPYNV